MPADSSDLTYGYCVACGGYGRGRYLHPIEDRAEAITEHVGCPATDRAEQQRQRQSLMRHRSAGRMRSAVSTGLPSDP